MNSEPTTRAQVCASFSRAAGTYAGHATVQQAMADWLAEWLPAQRMPQALRHRYQEQLPL